MNAIGPMLILVGIALFGWSQYKSHEFDRDVIKFENRCNAKGGLTLQAYKDGNGWIGCYKGVEEIENETAQ